MATSIKKAFSYQPAQESKELKEAFGTVLADLTALRASIVGVNAKLDADATVTDTNYAALWNPAALTLTS